MGRTTPVAEIYSTRADELRTDCSQAIKQPTHITIDILPGSTDTTTGSFAVQSTDQVGNIGNSTPFTMIKDTIPPTTSLSVPDIAGLIYDINWGAQDNEAGVLAYHIEYKDGAGSWTSLISGDTTKTSYRFVAEEGHSYIFRTQAVDRVGNWNPWQESTATVSNTVTKYYALGSQRVAMKRGTAYSFLHTDHLGSTVAVTNAAGQVVSQTRYRPFGGVQWQSGDKKTDLTFTGQRALDSGLMDYNARFYLPSLGRFLQPDTIIPGAGNPLAWDRYAYSNNNPLNYTDPSGHFATLATAFAGAAIGFAIDAGFQLVPQLWEGKAITECEYSIAQGAGAAAGGFVGGLTLGIGSGIIALAATGTTSVTGAAAVATGAMAGAAANALGNQAGALVQGSVETNSPLFSTTAINQATTYGYGNMNQMLTDSVVGAFTGGLTSIKFPAGNKISMIERSYPLDPGGSKWVSKTLTSKLGNEVRSIVPATKKGASYRALTDFGNWVSEGINQAMK